MRPNSSLLTWPNTSYAKLLCLILLVALTAVGCSDASVTNSANTSNSSNGAATANSTAKTPDAAASPSAAFKAFIEAAKKNDIAAISKLVSRDTLKMLSEQAAKNNKSLEAYITEENKDSAVTTQEIEVVGEKIDGDNATVEYTQRGVKIAALLVKEDGQWKIAYDKMMKQMEQEMEKAMPQK